MALYPSHVIKTLTSQKKKGHDIPLAHSLRQFHMQVLGTPGRGKTKFLEACIRQDILARHGLILLDPAGNLYHDIVKWCVENDYLERYNIVLLDAADPTYTFGFNPLEVPERAGESPLKRLNRIDGVVDATMWAIGSIQGDEDPESLPRYNNIMRLILALMAEFNLTLSDSHIFTDYGQQEAREALYERSANPDLRNAWHRVDGMQQREFDVLMEAPMNRLARFLSPSLACIVGQKRSTIDLRQCMDDGATVLVNLGSVPEEITESNMTILGRLLLNRIKATAAQRLRIDGQKPRPFYCYIDECDKYLNNDVASGIDKLRQFGLHMVLSHQNIGQLDHAGDKVKGAVLGSAAIKVYFSLTAEDVQTVSRNLYAPHLRLDKTIDVMDKPAVVGHKIAHVQGQTISEGHARGRAVGQSSGSSSMSGAGQVLVDQSGLFGMESELSHSLNQGHGQSSSQSVVESEVHSTAMARSISETFVPEIVWLPTQTEPHDFQLMQKEQELSHLRQGRCVIGLPFGASVDAQVKWIRDSVVSNERLRRATLKYFRTREERYLDKEDLFSERRRNSSASIVFEDETHSTEDGFVLS